MNNLSDNRSVTLIIRSLETVNLIMISPGRTVYSGIGKISALTALRRQRIRIDLIDHLPDSCPQRQIREDLDDTSLIRKRCLLQHGKVLHHTVMDNIFQRSGSQSR